MIYNMATAHWELGISLKGVEGEAAVVRKLTVPGTFGCAARFGVWGRPADTLSIVAENHRGSVCRHAVCEIMANCGGVFDYIVGAGVVEVVHIAVFHLFLSAHCS